MTEAHELRQASMRRLREFEVRPNRDLGQNFLIDDNILGVIIEAAELGRSDVALEIGGGLGVLTEKLAATANHVHVIEIDHLLEPALAQAVKPFENVTLTFADVLDLDLSKLNPPPNKLIANLPYGVAATSLIKALEEIQGLELICVMTQREVAQRLVAQPGGREYGISSVLVQLACDRVAHRKLSRRIFYPEPNVDSSLIVLRRIGPAADDDLKRLVQNGFAHRRKPLPSSLAHASGVTTSRTAAQLALTELGLSTTMRAEQLSPEQFRQLSDQLSAGTKAPRS